MRGQRDASGHLRPQGNPWERPLQVLGTGLKLTGQGIEGPRHPAYALPTRAQAPGEPTHGLGSLDSTPRPEPFKVEGRAAAWGPGQKAVLMVLPPFQAQFLGPDGDSFPPTMWGGAPQPLLAPPPSTGVPAAVGPQSGPRCARGPEGGGAGAGQRLERRPSPVQPKPCGCTGLPGPLQTALRAMQTLGNHQLTSDLQRRCPCHFLLQLSQGSWPLISHHYQTFQNTTQAITGIVTSTSPPPSLLPSLLPCPFEEHKKSGGEEVKKPK